MTSRPAPSRAPSTSGHPMRRITDQPAGPPGPLDPSRLLRWVIAFRLIAAAGGLVEAAVVWGDNSSFAFFVALVVLLAVTVSAYAGYTLAVRKLPATTPFLITQGLIDLLLASTLVHLAGSAASAVASLLVVLVAAYALLLPGAWGAVIALTAAGLYLGDAFAGGITVDRWILFGQAGVFGFVFLVVSILGHRLRTSQVERSRLRSELRRVRLEADEILRSIRTGVLTVDGHGRLAFINPTAERLLSLTSEQYLGKPVMDALRQRSAELSEAMESGNERKRRIHRGEGVVKRTDGTTFPIGLSTTTFERQWEALPAVTAIFNDISDTKHLQELHVRAERLEAVAALSASLAHEIRNPLASIRSSVEQLARSPRADADDRVLGDLIIRESDRLSRLLSEFLDFSRVRAAQFSSVNLQMVAAEAVKLVREHPECGKSVILDVQGERTVLDADEDLLHRVVTNLVLNAAQACASKGGGKVTVRVDIPPAAELPRGCGLDLPVRLQVSDNGPGIDPELQERLFQPFVSGRPGGSGLGLAIVQRAVQAHRGLVLLDTAPGVGTTFTILFNATWRTEEPA